VCGVSILVAGTGEAWGRGPWVFAGCVAGSQPWRTRLVISIVEIDLQKIFCWWVKSMAVFVAAIMLAISVVVVIGGVVSEGGRVTPRDSRRPPRTGVTLILFSLAVIGSLMAAGLGGRPSTPRASALGPAPSLSESQSAIGAVPVYPGPSNGAPLPRLNLPITYDYGPGPRHPVPPPASAPPPAMGANWNPGRSGPAPSTIPVSPPPVPLPSCVSSLEPAAPGVGSVRVIAPCLGG
jgi:hypothetical protein